jgi:hypothetical protein
MARQYPRFIFSNPQNTKSKGPFVIHTLEPRFIAKVEVKTINTFDISLLENWSSESDDSVKIYVEDANFWLFSQVKSGFIKLK